MRRTTIKPTRKRSGKRDLFTELTEGMDALANARTDERTLRTHIVEFKPLSGQLPLAIERAFAEQEKQRKRQGNADCQITQNINPQTPHSTSSTLRENE